MSNSAGSSVSARRYRTSWNGCCTQRAVRCRKPRAASILATNDPCPRRTFRDMDSSAHAVASTEKAERKAARELVAHYHEAELRQLLEHVRSGFLRFDAGAINAFELDEIIHRYKRAAARLWSFCGSSGGRWQQ